jgi:RNA-dependent RNA polymerase
VALANILHSQEYSSYSSSLLNFDIRLFPNRRTGHGHSGQGALTLPTEALGVQFLRDYGWPTAQIITVGNRTLRFVKSKKNVRSDVVEAIRRLPYLDPKVLEEREKRAAELRESIISVQTIQFGWECRDSVFSVEWEKYCIDACSIFFEDNPRQLRIKYFAPSETRIIAIRFSQIRWSATSLSVRGKPTIFLSLQTPPSFESEITPERMDQFQRSQQVRPNGTVYDIEPRQRLSAFDDEYVRIAPYASLAIRLICRDGNHVLRFRRLCRDAQMEPSDFDYPVEYRSIFSARNLDSLQEWLQALDFEVAFQVESLTRALIVDIEEMLDLRADIDKIVETNGAQYTSALLRHFSGQARMLLLSGDDESNEYKETIRQCFQRSEKEFKLQAPSSTATTGDTVFDCLHVIQTPTTIYLEGPFPERSNRVIRSYPNHHSNFLRVSFTDEIRLQYRFDREVDGRTFIRNRVGGALLSGISVAGRSFKFLAYSQSALKEHAVRKQPTCAVQF